MTKKRDPDRDSYLDPDSDLDVVIKRDFELDVLNVTLNSTLTTLHNSAQNLVFRFKYLGEIITGLHQ